MGYLTTSTNVRSYQTSHRSHFFFQEDSTLVHMHCACNTVQLLHLSRLDFLSLKPCPQQPKMNAMTTRFRVIQQREHESWVKKTEEIKERLVEFWQCTDTAFEWKNAIFVFPILPDSAEAYIIWGGTVKHFWLLTLWVTFLPKRIKMCLRMSKL